MMNTLRAKMGWLRKAAAVSVLFAPFALPGAAVLQPPALAAQGAPGKPSSKYQNADEAFAVGAAFHNSQNYAASREPFEAALRLAPDDVYRLKVYRALIPAYRLLPDDRKMYEAVEFILDHSDPSALRATIALPFLSFLHQRGKIDDAVQRYEKLLAKEAENKTALFLLAEIYDRTKRDPLRALELAERLAKLREKELSAAGKKPGAAADAPASARLAGQYVKAKKYREGAELYEEIAPLNQQLAAWHWKEAALAWLKLDDKPRALAAAKKSAAAPPEQRSQLLTHFWHRHLGDVFLAADEPALAAAHYEQAIANTNIEGYIQDCQKALAEARDRAAK